MQSISWYEEITEDFTVEDLEKTMEKVNLEKAEDFSREYGFKSLPSPVSF